MYPGPDFIYKCPHCDNLLKRGSLSSGNTFGATLYSDGKQVAPMLPEFPNLTKCKKCNNIFWIKDLIEIGGYFKWHDSSIVEEFKTEDMRKKWETAEEVEFLGVKDLHKALDMTKDPKEEKTIRLWIWWAFNDRVREGGEEMFFDKDDKDLWEKNCRTLLNLLNNDEKLIAAELYRNLGEFEKCIEVIDHIDNKDINWIKDPLKYRAKMNSTQTFSFQSFDFPNNRSRGLPFFQMRGEIKEKQGYYQGALDDYEKAIFLDDSNPFFYVLKAGVYEKLRKPAIALENFDKALSINPDFADAYINRALFFRRRKKFKEAQEDYQKAMSLEPRFLKITTFSEVDIFKYGKFESIVDDARIFDIFEEGSLYVHINFSPYKKAEHDSSLFINAKKLPYFIFRKKQKKPITDKRWVRFEFLLAKCLFYINAYVLKRNDRFINFDTILN